MIARVAIDGLGPCADRVVDLDPNGVTTITGPSETGKSTLIRAVVLALLGVDVDGTALDARAIRDNASRLEVEITTAKGTRVYRSLTRSRSQVRRVTPAAQEPVTFGSEEEFARQLGIVASKKLGAAGRQVHAARLILAPLSWVALASESGGRPLREVLSQLVPGDVRAEVAALMGGDLQDGDPVDERAAVEARKLANAARDEALGAVREAQASMDSLVEPPEAVDVEEARRTLAAAERHERYAEALAAHELAVTAREAWRARRTALGEAPRDPGPMPDSKDQRSELAKIEAQIERLSSPSPATAPARVTELRAELQAARARLVELEAAGETCPTCGRDGWTHARVALDSASLAVRGLEEQVEIAEAEASVAAGEADEKRQKDLASLEKRRDVIRRAIQDAEGAVARWRVDSDAYIAWRRAAAGLGPEPEVPAEPAPNTGRRPSDDQVALARRAVETAQTQEGARRQYERARQQAESRVTASKTTLERAQARATRLDRLVEAVRKAPAARARRQAEVLGDLGPVSFEVTSSGVEVLVDGRPWWLASRGRLVVADLWLRAGLRRAVGMPWCPLFVDDAQAWSGDWPSVPGPVVFLRTEAGDFVARRAA